MVEIESQDTQQVSEPISENIDKPIVEEEVDSTASEKEETATATKEDIAAPAIVEEQSTTALGHPMVSETTGIQIAQGDAKITMNNSLEEIENFVEKGIVGAAATDEDFIKEGSKEVQKKIITGLKNKNKKQKIDNSKDTLESLSHEAQEYYNYHQKILGVIGIDRPLSVASMKFWMVIGTFYYFILRIFYFIKDICVQVLDIVSYVFETIVSSVAKVITSIMDMLTKILTSSSKAIKAFGWVLIAALFILLIIGIIYLIPKLTMNFDIFEWFQSLAHKQ